MAAPTLQAQGSSASNTTGNLAITLPAYTTNDIVVITTVGWVPNTTTGTNTQSLASPWNKYSPDITTITGGIIDAEYAFWWARATSSSSLGTTVTITRPTSWDTGTDTCWAGRAYVIRGCETTGNPFDQLTATAISTAANPALPAVTVSAAERNVIAFYVSADNNTAPTAATGYTVGTADTTPTGTDAGFQTYSDVTNTSLTTVTPTGGAAPAQGGQVYFSASFKKPLVTLSRTATNTGTGTQSATKVITKSRTASGTGTGTGLAIGSNGVKRTASASGIGTQTSTYNFYTIIQRTATNSGTGSSGNTTYFKRVRSGTASGGATNGDQAIRLVTSKRTASNSGSGTQSAVGVIKKLRTASATGTGSQSASAIKKKLRTASESGIGTQSVTQIKSLFRSASSTATSYENAGYADLGWVDSYYSITISSRGYDFLQWNPSLVLASSQLSIDSSLTVNATATQVTKSASVSISIDSDLVISGTEIQFASTTINATSNTVAISTGIRLASGSFSAIVDLTTEGIEQLRASIGIDSSVSVSITSIKFAYSSINISSDVTTQIVGREILYANSQIIIDSNLAASSLEIAKAQTTLSIQSNTSISTYKIQYTTISIASTSQLNVLVNKSTSTSSTVSGNLVSIINGTRIQPASANIGQLDGSVTVTAKEILYASSTISIQSALTASGTEALVASININTDGSILCSATHIRHINPSISLSINTDITILSLKAKSIEDGWTDSYYSVTFPGRGYRFYGVDAITDLVIVRIYGESDVVTSATRIHNAQISIDASVSVTCSAVKKLLSIPATSNMTVKAQAIKFGESQLEITCQLNILTIKLGIVDVDEMSSSVTSTQVAKEILYATSSISSTSVTVIVGKEYQLAKISINAQLSMLIAGATRFSSSIIEDTQSIRTLLIIDNKPITEHNRKISSTIIQSFIEQKNWESSRSRYYKPDSGRKSFSISWKEVPNLRNDTVDLRFGRDFITEIGSDPDIHILKVLNTDSDGVTPYTETEYNVIVKSYSESLVRRDLVGESYLWDCNLELEEV